MKHPVQVGDYIQLPGTYTSDGAIVMVSSLTPSGQPRYRAAADREELARKWRRSSAEQYAVQERDRELASHRHALSSGVRKLCDGITLGRRHGAEAVASERIADLCLAYLTAIGRPHVPPLAPEASALLRTMRELHQSGALADCYDVQDGHPAPLDAAVTEWVYAGYPGAGGES